MKKQLFFWMVIGGLLLAAAGYQRPPAVADATAGAVITVDTTADVVDSSGDCSLREAILAANADAPIDGCPAGSGRDIVVLPAGTFTFARAGSGEDSAFTGDLDLLDDLSLIGAGYAETIVDAAGLDSVFHLPPFATAEIAVIGITVQGGEYGFNLNGAGTFDLLDSRVKGNQVGILNTGGITELTIDGGRIDHNSGRGISSTSPAGGLLMVRDSLIDHNRGGGISHSGGELVLVNSTISGNQAPRHGGGIYLAGCPGGQVRLLNATIYDNESDSDRNQFGEGGGLFYSCSSYQIEMANTIIAGNVDRTNAGHDCGSWSGSDMVLESAGYNLIGDASTCNVTGFTQNNILNQDPFLGSLVAGSSGPSKAHALLPQSPAIDAGNPLACVDEKLDLLDTDQIGSSRPQDGDNDGSPRCDIGAFETTYIPPSPTAASTIFTVDRTTDLSDLQPGDGLCDVSVNVGEQCTLRAAIEELNALGPGLNPHQIRFDIPGSGVHVITPASNLPLIAVPVHINGASQPGASCPTDTEPARLLIQLDGSHAGRPTTGLSFNLPSSGSTVTGLVITNFENEGIFAFGDEHRIRCNIIGLDPDGVTPQGNRTGLYLVSIGIQVGDLDDVSWRNVIGGNQLHGIVSIAAQLDIEGNFIGTSADGRTAVGSVYGLLLMGTGNRIRNNVISGSELGIMTSSAANNNEVSGNLIGVAADGVTPLPNTLGGIVVDDSYGIAIGGPGALANQIAYNGGAGVRVSGGQDITIRHNVMHDNGELAIDLAPGGVNGNDDQDGDGGANGRQNFPVLSARPAGFVVDGRLNSTPNTTFLVDAYRSSACDDSNYGEGETFIQTVQVQTDAAGQVEFKLDLRGDLENGDYVTATATDPAGSTSEFSRCVRVGSRLGLALTVNQDGDLDDAAPADGVCDTLPNLSGEQCTLRAALTEINALGVVSDSYHIGFDIAAAGVVTITPASPLPAVQVPVELDGLSQDGASCPSAGEPAELKIVLDGSAISTSASGLILDDGSDGSFVRGLVIGNFRAFGLRLNGDDNYIVCNHIGIGADGLADMGNGFSGIYVSGTNNRIGDPLSPNRGNVIGHNGGDGIFINSAAAGTIVSGNRIGTTAAGWQAAGNQGSGIMATSEGSLIGGYGGGGNLIGGNGRDGVLIYFADRNEISGNLIGLDREGLGPLPNGRNGVAILGSSSHNRVGISPVAQLDPRMEPDAAGAAQPAEWGNHIAFNLGHGILVRAEEGISGSGNTLQRNHIHDNGGLGIDLAGDGVDLNDPGDLDEGANDRQNAPVLTVQPGSRTLEIVLHSLPETTFEVELFRSLACDPSGFGEGQQWQQSRALTTDETGQASALLDLSGAAAVGTALTATATHEESGSTSEFSNCVILLGDVQPAFGLYLPVIRR